MTLHLKSRIWLEEDGKILLGEGRIKLLEAIMIHGSINLACKSLGMSYKKAWNLIETMNKTSKHQLVTRKIGGSGGGGTQVTPHGVKIISQFNKIKNNVWSLLDQETELLNQQDD